MKEFHKDLLGVSLAYKGVSIIGENYPKYPTRIIEQ
jgi:hypothetical protein